MSNVNDVLSSSGFSVVSSISTRLNPFTNRTTRSSLGYLLFNLASAKYDLISKK